MLSWHDKRPDGIDVVKDISIACIVLTEIYIIGACYILCVSCTGVGIYKGRDCFQTSKRAGTDFCPCFTKASNTRHSVLHHQAAQEDQQFLQEDRENSDDTPHGALEIDL